MATLERAWSSTHVVNGYLAFLLMRCFRRGRSSLRPTYAPYWNRLDGRSCEAFVGEASQCRAVIPTRFGGRGVFGRKGHVDETLGNVTEYETSRVVWRYSTDVNTCFPGTVSFLSSSPGANNARTARSRQTQKMDLRRIGSARCIVLGVWVD